MRCCPEHVCIYIQIYTHTTCNFFFTDEELLSHPWNTAMLEVMVQLTDDNPMSIATTLDMLQLVNMIAQNICCYSPVGRAGTSWNTLYWLKSFLRGSGVQNLKKERFKKISSPKYLPYYLLLWWYTSTLQVLDSNTGHAIVTESLETMLVVSQFLQEQKKNSLSSHLQDQCCNLIKKVWWINIPKIVLLVIDLYLYALIESFLCCLSNILILGFFHQILHYSCKLCKGKEFLMNC